MVAILFYAGDFHPLLFAGFYRRFQSDPKLFSPNNLFFYLTAIPAVLCLQLNLSEPIYIMKDTNHPESKKAANMSEPSMFRGVVRGMLPMYLLSLLMRKPHHGNEIMKAIEKMSNGTWKPSPGSVYPLLKKLEDDGLISGEWVSGRAAAARIYSVTRKGRSRLPVIQKQLLAELCMTRDALQQHITILKKVVSDRENSTSAL